MYMFNLQHNIHTCFFNHVHHVWSAKQPNTAPYKNAVTHWHTSNILHYLIQIHLIYVFNNQHFQNHPAFSLYKIPSTCDQSLEKWPKRSTLPRRAPPWSTDDAGPAWWDHSDGQYFAYNSYIIIHWKKNALDSTRCVYFGCYLVVKIQSTWLWQHTFG